MLQPLFHLALIWVLVGLVVGAVRLSRRHRLWLREGIVVRRWQYILGAFVVGVGIALGILFSAKALRDLNHEREIRGRQLQAEAERRIKAELLTKADVTNIAKRVVRLEQPTKEQQVRRLTRTLKDLLASRKLQRQFGIKAITLTSPPPTVAITKSPVVIVKKTPTKKKATTTPKKKTPSGGGQTTTVTTPTPPQSTPPIVSITPPTPLPIHVCTGLIDIGCKRP